MSPLAETCDRGTDCLPDARIHDAYRGEKTLVRTWESLTAWADAADHAWDDAGQDKWAGGSLAEALSMARGKGWASSRDAVARIVAHISSVTDAETIADSFEYRYDVTGGAVDVARYLEGVPESMIETIPQKVARRGKVVRIVVPVAYQVGVKQALVKRRGAAIIALIEAMSKAHYSLEVWALSGGHGDGRPSSGIDRVTYMVRIQEASAPFDPALVAYGVGHPTMFRRLTFSASCRENQTVRDDFGIGSYYFMFHQPHDACLADLPVEYQGSPAIILPALGGRGDGLWDSDEKIARWIENQIERITEGVGNE